MVSNEQFWNSITMTPTEFKTKYFTDTEFWTLDGSTMYENMKIVAIDKPKKSKKIKEITPEEAERLERIKKFKNKH